MMPCCICGVLIPGVIDDDVCCASCDTLNLAGDPLRHPPRQQRHPLPWWQRDRLPLAPRRDGLRALTYIHGPWTWHEDNGVEEDNHV